MKYQDTGIPKYFTRQPTRKITDIMLPYPRIPKAINFRLSASSQSISRSNIKRKELRKSAFSLVFEFSSISLNVNARKILKFTPMTSKHAKRPEKTRLYFFMGCFSGLSRSSHRVKGRAKEQYAPNIRRFHINVEILHRDSKTRVFYARDSWQNPNIDS